ncbi:dihydropteroate synthase [Pseudaestuariivita sp.]|uniref:dihydropteroate synthase n=1 Tax=Pseudaestuariivita sp. TaxID=2211669 RepID=UPI0040595A79
MYVRPLVQSGPHRPPEALTLAGGRQWFTEALVLSRTEPPRRIAAENIPQPQRARLTTARVPIMGLDMSRPNVMGILNVTPDSFSDGGLHSAPARAAAAAVKMATEGADLLDIGGESTRPGAAPVPFEAEIARIEPVLRALRHRSDIPVSIDTRKASVAEVATTLGAGMINDVSGFTFDAALAPLAVARGVQVCVMHAQGDPQTMQENPRYDDVLLDVYDFLEVQIAYLEGLGLTRGDIVVDPGIGFGKTQAHNLALLEGLALFHALGCCVLVGASRKGFIGRISGTPEASQRLGGSVAVALAAAAQGAQLLRVHDVKDTAQALKLWQAVTMGAEGDTNKTGEADHGA